MAVSYTNIFFDYCLDPLRDLFITEYSYGKIYIGPELKFNEPFQVRLWISDSNTEEWS